MQIMNVDILGLYREDLSSSSDFGCASGVSLDKVVGDISNVLSKLTPEAQQSLELDKSLLHEPKIFNIHDLHFESIYKTLYLQKNSSFLALNDVKK